MFEFRFFKWLVQSVHLFSDVTGLFSVALNLTQQLAIDIFDRLNFRGKPHIKSFQVAEFWRLYMHRKLLIFNDPVEFFFLLPKVLIMFIKELI